MLHDRGVALPDARRFDDHEIEAGDLARCDRIGQRLRNFFACLARCQRAHVDLRAVGPRIDRIHADAIAEQCAAALATRRIDRDHRDLQLVALIEANAAHQLVAQARLACAAGAGDAERRHLRGVGCLVQRLAKLDVRFAQFQRGDRARQRAPALGLILVFQCIERFGRERRQIDVALGDHRSDHSLQTELLPVFRREDARDAVVVQLLDLGADDDAAAAAVDADVFAAALAQQIDHVLEELDVPALVRADRDALHVFLQRRGDDLLDRAIVTQMNHFNAHALQNAPHDVDRRIVPVEQRRRGDEAHLVRRAVLGELLDFGEIGHEGLNV